MDIDKKKSKARKADLKSDKKVSNSENRINTIRKLLTYFNFSVDTTKKVKLSGESPIKPIKTKKITSDDGKATITTVEDRLSPNAMAAFRMWQSNVYLDLDRIKDREDLWRDMEDAYFNSAIIGKAVKLTADEVVQADMNFMPVGVEAPRKQRKFILELFDKIGLYSKVASIAEDLVLYGNAGQMLGFDSEGLSEMIPIDVFDIKERLEFNAAEVRKELSQKGSLLNSMKSYQRVNALIQSIEQSETFSADYKTYLLGFVISDNIVPPWRFIHFRLNSSKSRFRPYGMPMYVNSLAPYYQYDAGLTLQVAARGASFPIDKYTLNIPESVSSVTKLEKAIEFIREFDNSGMGGTKKEGVGIGGRVVTVKDSFDFEQITSDIDLGKIDDIELLREDLVDSTDIPSNFFLGGKSGWAASGISIVQQYKPFARRVHKVQSSLLEGLTQMVKIAMIQSNQFSLEEIDFILTMPYPESQTSSEVISAQSDLMRLANDVLESLASKLFDGEPSELPLEVIRQVYHQILPYDQTRIDNWLSIIEKDRKKMDNNIDSIDEEIKGDTGQGGQEELDYFHTFGSSLSSNRFRGHESLIRDDAEQRKDYGLLCETRGGKEKFKEFIEKETFRRRQEIMREYVAGGKHYFSSKNRVDDFPAEKLIEIDKQRIEDLNRLQESDNMSIKDLQQFNENYIESIKYQFESDRDLHVEHEDGKDKRRKRIESQREKRLREFRESQEGEPVNLKGAGRKKKYKFESERD